MSSAVRSIDSSKDYYEILGVDASATVSEIKNAYRKVAQRYHPDRLRDVEGSQSADDFKRISAAYSVLSDPEQRQKYDRSRNPRVKTRVSLSALQESLAQKVAEDTNRKQVESPHEIWRTAVVMEGLKLVGVITLTITAALLLFWG